MQRKFDVITRNISKNPIDQGLACYNWIKSKIAYKQEKNDGDEWQLPSLTLRKQSGDCEDHAFLLTSFLLIANLKPYFCRGYELGSSQFHAFVVVVNAPRTGLNYWDTTTERDPNFPPYIIFEAINQNGIANRLASLNFIPATLPLLKIN